MLCAKRAGASRAPGAGMTSGKYSIGTKIFGAFIAMSVIIAILGAAAYGVLSSAGNMAATTFDGPLMAVHYAGAAQSDFISLQMAELRFENAPDRERAAIAGEINNLSATFTDDLAVAQQRSLAPEERRLIRQINALVGEWREARKRGDSRQLERLDTLVDDKFDFLI